MAIDAQPLFDIVLDFVAAKDLGDGFREGDDTVIRFEGDGTNGAWLLFLSTDEDAERMSVHSAAPFLVDEDRRAAVMELVTRINNEVAIGSYDFDLETGQLAFRTGIDVEGDRLSAALVSQLVAANVGTFNSYLPALESVAHEGAEPRAALAAAGV